MTNYKENKDWTETLLVENVPVLFKLDSGAQCNVLSERIANKINCKIMQSNTKRLTSYSEHKIPVIGEIKPVVKTKHHQSVVTFKVVSENFAPILGRVSCESLGLLKRVNSISPDHEIFNGLACLKNL